MKPAAALALAALAFAFASCQDADKSYDAMHGPENVLMAPYASEDNRQQDGTNRKLWEKSLEDSAMLAKHEKEDMKAEEAPQASMDSSAAGEDSSAKAGVNPSADTHAPDAGLRNNQAKH